MFKNVASQKVAIFAWDNANSVPKTGDAANISAQISIDGAATAATNDVAPTELDATDAKGIYIFDMTQGETNGDLIVISPVSSTADIDIRPVIIYTQTVMRGTDSAATAASLTTVEGKIDTVDANVDSILVDTAEIGTAGAGLTDLGGMSTGMKAEINAEVVDTLDTDTYAEPAGVPAATASLTDKVGWLFALARNKITQTATTQTLRNDADGADIATSAVSDDGTTTTRAEWT